MKKYRESIINLPWPKNKIEDIQCNFSDVKVITKRSLLSNEFEIVN